MADDPSLTRQAIAALDAALVTQNPLERMRLVDRALRLHRQAAVGSAPEPQAGPTSQAQPPSAAG